VPAGADTGAMSPFGDDSAVVPMQKVIGQRSQVAAQQGDGMAPTDQAVTARNATNAIRPTVRLRPIMPSVSTPGDAGYSERYELRLTRGQMAVFLARALAVPSRTGARRPAL
jgi:hypothetical protein